MNFIDTNISIFQMTVTFAAELKKLTNIRRSAVEMNTTVYRSEVTIATVADSAARPTTTTQPPMNVN